MPLPESGAISFSEINDNLGRGHTSSISLGDSQVEGLIGHGQNQNIDMNSLHGKGSFIDITSQMQFHPMDGSSTYVTLKINGQAQGIHFPAGYLGASEDCYLTDVAFIRDATDGNNFKLALIFTKQQGLNPHMDRNSYTQVFPFNTLKINGETGGKLSAYIWKIYKWRWNLVPTTGDIGGICSISFRLYVQ